ncbi:MAG: L-glutamate gamma-semialdehyde dehydrogenase [Candidatus Heimdallarchaeota archaeon]|nr:L-glutamate gamma-semialdehyde dehydrogenase [Candidatus Heimdallarchaeota archaeon]
MGNFKIPNVDNEPILGYMPGSDELKTLQAELEKMQNEVIDIPLIIGGKRIFTEDKGKCVIPHNHKHVLATYSMATKEHIDKAIEAAAKAKKDWAKLPWNSRAAIFFKAAELLAGPYRAKLNAATMLNQSKNVFQAEIDSACELIDFFRFNAKYMEDIYHKQPDSAKGIWNQVEYRPLEGFVFAVTPFNFTSIAGNLPTSPALMGNTVLWKPASSAVFSAYYLMELFEEAGFPPGVINFIPGKGSQVGPNVLPHRDLAGIHFTGSTGVFQGMWKTIGENIANYKSYPRIVGETGGKDFVFVHNSADLRAVATAIIRGAFEYAGQKCSAASRAYIPESVWPELKEMLLKDLAEVKMGDPTNVDVLVNAVIDKAAFDSITAFVDYAKESEDAEIIFGGNYDESTGYFIEPTLVVTTDPHFKLMEEEIFGPVMTMYIYKDDDFKDTLKLCDATSPYALTGSIFARDRYAINKALKKLRHAAGNFYINDKPTGAVVNQQPFGGARASGTNDKAGSYLNLIRWTSPRSIKETFVPPTYFDYPYMRKSGFFK